MIPKSDSGINAISSRARAWEEKKLKKNEKNRANPSLLDETASSLKQNLPSNIGKRGKNGEFIIEFPCIPRKKGKLVDYMFSLGNAVFVEE